MKIVFASNNAGKVKEMNALVQREAIDIIPQANFGVTDVAETGKTFVENAILKARHAAAQTKLPTIADDSGLVVGVLHGEPGIYSARYAGEPANAAQNIKKLLANLQSIDDEERHAFFYCCLVYMQHANDAAPLICEGRWHGTILREAQGEAGFGYDPIFWIPSEQKTAAELSMEIKNKLSHRGQALRSLVQNLISLQSRE